jgi:probable phosphoglycerate mutase
MRQTVREDEAFREIPAPVPLGQRQIWLRQFMQQQWHEQVEGLIAWRTAALNRLLALQQPAVVFTHFLVINAIVGQVLARDETLCFWPANGSITRLRHHGTGLELIQLGEELTTMVN